MEKILVTKLIDERNELIKSCYERGVKYSYWEKNNEDNYIVKYEE